MSLRAPWDDVAPPSASPLRTNAEAFRDTLHDVSLLTASCAGALDAATFRSVSEVVIADAEGAVRAAAACDSPARS